jgi:hypothetical protein
VRMTLGAAAKLAQVSASARGIKPNAAQVA